MGYDVSLIDGHIDEPKMTDEEIIEALEGMTYGGHSCMHCKYGTTKDDDRCGLQGCKIGRDALDLINRKDAEIERLNKILENRGEICKLCEGKYTEKIKRAKAKAIKEFAHLLIDKAKKGVIYAMDIPDYVKEMVGD